MEPIEIYLGTTSIGLDTKVLKIFGKDLRIFTKSKLTDYVYDPRIRRRLEDKSYTFFDQPKNNLYLPFNYLPELVQFFKDHSMRPVKLTRVKPYVSKSIDLSVKPNWTPRENQIEPIKYLSQSYPRRRGLELQTGQGKTFCSIRSLVNIDKVTLIIAAGLVDQWVKQLLEITNIHKKDLYVIQGFKSIAKLFDSNLKPKVIVGSLQTLRMYAYGDRDYNLLPSYSTFLKQFKVGTKIMDEVHLNFHAMTQLDLRSNIANNIYLTATFDNNKPSTKRIFNIIYPHKLRFGAGEYKRYVGITFYAFLSEVSEKKVCTKRGYMHARYENELMKKKTKYKRFINNAMQPIINSHFDLIKNKGEKCLIFFSTTQMIEMVRESLQKIYPKLKIISFIGDDPDTLLSGKADILLSTYKKAGTGKDIKNLRTVVNTVSTQARTTVVQILGRLRKLPNNVIPEFVDIFDPSISSHVRHYNVRSEIYKDRGIKYNQFKLY